MTKAMESSLRVNNLTVVQRDVNASLPVVRQVTPNPLLPLILLPLPTQLDPPLPDAQCQSSQEFGLPLSDTETGCELGANGDTGGNMEGGEEGEDEPMEVLPPCLDYFKKNTKRVAADLLLDKVKRTSRWYSLP
jgi:hypothetical protein